LHAARGKDWEEVSDEISEDNAYAIKNAIRTAKMINEEFPDSPQVNWRDLMPLPMPQGVTVAMQDPGAIKNQETELQAVATEPEAVEDAA